MSTVLVVTPIVVANWPAITAAVTAAVSSMGFAARQARDEAKQGNVAREELEVENSEILAEAAGSDAKICVQREGLTATFSRDARGGLRVCMEGKAYTKAQLRQIGQELIDRVTQQYVYHRMVTELQQRKMTIVGEEVAEDGTVKIRVRNW